MKDPASTPVSAIESIGPRSAELLSTMDVRFVADICRYSTTQLYGAVSSIASRERVDGWRIMAYLLWVPGMTSQWAEALWQAGLGSLESFVSSSLSDLRDTFTNALSERIIPTLPSDDDMVRMMCDAAILADTGQLTGRVLDDQKQDVSGAEIKLGYRHAQSDHRGLFHLKQIPLGRAEPLIITMPQGETYRFESTPVEKDFYLISTHEFNLTSDIKVTSDDDVLLSELAGDRLPSLAGAESRVARLEDGEMREGDILLYRKIVASGDAELVSRYRSYQHARLLVHTMRLPVSQLPKHAKAGEHFRVHKGKLETVNIDASRLNLLRKARQATALQDASHPAPVTKSEYAERFRQTLNLMR